jgi:membrane protease YdiL (CAAX protease family)
MSREVKLESVIFFDHLEPKRRTWLLALPLLTIVFFVVGQLLAVIPVFETGLLDPDTIEQYPDILYMLFGPFTMITVLLFCWVKFFEKRSLQGIGVNYSQSTKSEILQGYLVGLAMACTIVTIIFICGAFQPGKQAPVSLISLLPPLLLFLGFGIQATTEEVVFRGWLLSRIAEQKGKTWGVVGSSLMFSFVHLLAFNFEDSSTVNLIIFASMTFVFSVFLALVTIGQKSIWFAASWHAAWNWVYINGFGLPTTGIVLDTRPLIVNLDFVESSPGWLSGGLDGPENSIVALAVLVLGCFFSWKIFRRDISSV